MTNPFVYGEVVPPAAFVDREDELDRLTRDLLAGQKVFLISPRRYGKSSLVRQALRAAARGGALIVDVTVSSYSSYVGFLEGYARALVVGREADRPRDGLAARRARRRCGRKCESSRPPAGKRSGRASRSRRPAPSGTCRGWRRKSSRCPAGSPRAAAASWRSRSTSSRRSAPSTAAASSMRCAPRSSMQRDVGYVFSGSEPALMERMLGRSRPFYKAGPVMRLRTDSRRSVRARSSRARLARAAASNCAARSRPGDRRARRQPALRRAAARARAVGRCPRGRAARRWISRTCTATLTRLLGEHETLFEATWQRLTLAQRGALRAAVLEDGPRAARRRDARARYRLSGASTVQASLAALVREDILAREGDRYVVVDSLLREWVARRTF